VASAAASELIGVSFLVYVLNVVILRLLGYDHRLRTIDRHTAPRNGESSTFTAVDCEICKYIHVVF